MSYASEVHSATGVRMKLSVMMFLEFFIWGAWLPLIFGYLPSLGFSPLQQSWVLNAFALASFTAMFFFTQFADRNFAAEKFVAVSHLIGGLSILGLFKSRELAAVVEQAGLSAETAHFVTFLTCWTPDSSLLASNFGVFLPNFARNQFSAAGGFSAAPAS